MYYIKYKNKGEIDVNAFRLMGASTKENDDNKIGFFGSGLKYAIAVLLRNGIDLKVYSGDKEIKIGTRKTKLRGEEFYVITINGTPTFLTTRMGKDWEIWYAVREVYCNCLDEGGVETEVVEDVKAEKGFTNFYIQITDDIENVHKNWDHYFSDKLEPMHEYNQNKIFHNVVDNELRIYRRNMLVHHNKEKCLYNYDIYNAEINESRALKSLFSTKWDITSLWKGGANREMISKLFGSEAGGSFEWDFDWSHGTSFSSLWLECVDDRIVVPDEYAGNFIDDLSSKNHLKLPYSLCKELKKQFKNQIIVRGIDGVEENNIVRLVPNERELRIIEESKEFLKNAGVDIQYKISVADLGEFNGEAKNNEIFLARKTFDLGKREVVETILEEYAHLESSQADRTRGFQDYLLKMILKQMEEKTNIYL